MAAIAKADITAKGDRQPVGAYFLQTFQVNTTAPAEDDEYIAKADIGASQIIAIVGSPVVLAPNMGAMIGAACIPNANGAGSGHVDGESLGDVGIRTSTSSTTPMAVQVTVLFKP